MSASVKQLQVDDLDRAISRIGSRSGVIRLGRILRRQPIDLSDPEAVVTVLTRFIDLASRYKGEVEEEGEEEGEGGLIAIDKARAVALTGRSNCRYYLSQYQASLDDAELCLSIARNAGDLDMQANAYSCISASLDALGRTRDAMTAISSAIEIRKMKGNGGQELARSLYNLAQYEVRTGHAKQRALERIDEALYLYNECDRSRDDVREGIFCSHTLRMKVLTVGFGRVGEAAIDAVRVTDMMDQIANPALRNWAHTELVGYYITIEVFSKAMEHCMESLRHARESGIRAVESAALKKMADIQVLSGATEEALDNYNQALEIAIECGHTIVESNIRLSLAQQLSKLGMLEDAAAHAARGLEIVGENESRAELLVESGRIQSLRDDRVGAEARLEEAIRFARDRGFSRALTRARFEVARICSQNGQIDRAIALLEEILPKEHEGTIDQSSSAQAISDGHALLVRLYRESGEYQKALEHSERLRMISTRRSEALADRRLASYRVLYEVDRLHQTRQAERYERERAEQSLALLSNELIDRQQLISRLSRDLRSLVKSSGPQHPDMIRGVRSSLRLIESKPEPGVHVHSHLSRENGEFIDLLRQQHPNLTPGQLQLGSLLWSGMRTDEIASILHVTIDAVRMGRKRLRKALQLPKEIGLEAYLRDLSADAADDPDRL